MNSALGQRILSLVRDGDYAHAGEEEAIELAMARVDKDAGRLILDAGCGRGGTADYLHRHGWGRVIGIDIELGAIRSAQANYPGMRFLTGDICDVDRQLVERPDIICMFNAYYCFADQPKALAALRRVAVPQTRMIVFDHVDRGRYRDEPLMDAGMPFLPNPLRLAEVSEAMLRAGWQAPDIVEIHADYARWYAGLVGKIERSRESIVEIAGTEGYAHVRRLYQGLRDAAADGKLGAAIISTVPA